MKRLIILLVCAVWMLCLGDVFAKETQILELDVGENNVSLKVVNRKDVPISGLEMIVNPDELPMGILIGNLSQQINIPENSTGSDTFQFTINVEDFLVGSTFNLPLLLRDANGQEWNYTVKVQVGDTSIPRSFKLYQNEPNPFNPSTLIRYELASQEAVSTKLEIFNTLGQKVRTLVNRPQSMGSCAVRWDGRNDNGNKLSSGIYIYRLISGKQVSIKKMLFVQ